MLFNAEGRVAAYRARLNNFMVKFINVANSDNELAIIGGFVIPSDSSNSTAAAGAIRFNPNSLAIEVYYSGAWNVSSGGGGSGPTGPTGPAGTAGTAGSTGPTGHTGATGATGAAGTVGVTGPTGPAGGGGGGVTGPTGPTGPSGTAGAAGAAGAAGTAGAVGATGPTGATGPASTVLISDASSTLTVAATVGAAAHISLITTSSSLLCVQVMVTTTGPTQNYTLGLYDGDPTVSGVLVYQATGITATSFADNAPFFAAVASGAMWAEITNIDADATVATLTVSYLVLA